MNDKIILIEMLFEKAEQYARTTLALYKLKVIDKATDIFASLFTRIVIFIFLTIFFILMTLGLALYLGDLLGKNYYGFFAVGGFYFLISLVLYLFRKSFESMFNDYLVNQIFKDKNNANN
ncbi:MAG: hypothetical protein H7250_00510 [Flavobacterium sp.]|nr:hypothetical protein [Flavobacterium sp.]